MKLVLPVPEPCQSQKVERNHGNDDAGTAHAYTVVYTRRRPWASLHVHLFYRGIPV